MNGYLTIDYAALIRDTSGLSVEQNGVLFLLYKDWWQWRKPIKDSKQAYKLVNPMTKHEKELIDDILRRFFRPTNGITHFVPTREYILGE